MAGGKYASFEDYCKKRWDWQARYVQQVCKSAGVAARIENAAGDSAKGEKRTIVRPANERHARPLAKLPEEEQPEAWAEAVESAD